MPTISIDRSKRLKEEAHLGHNRWHPDIPPIVAVDPGEEAVLETRDASDGQIRPTMTAADLAGLDAKVGHPLTGPVYIKGAEPGDLLEVEYLDIVAQPYGWTRNRPGAGFLRDLFTEPYLAHWNIADGWATSAQLPGVRITDGSFMGTAGLAPSHAQLKEWAAREAEYARRGGIAAPPDPEDAAPAGGVIASEGLRTIPPRENCGNVDAKQLTKGSRLFIPVAVAGGLYSAGDGHFAQGDGEVCITAIEMGATAAVRFAIHKGQAARHNITMPRYAHPGYFLPPEWAAPRNFTATLGYPIRADGTQEGEEALSLAARNALLNMIALLQERGWTAEQAYIICSVAVDLRVSNIVDLPNITVSAFLPGGHLRRLTAMAGRQARPAPVPRPAHAGTVQEPQNAPAACHRPGRFAFRRHRCPIAAGAALPSLSSPLSGGNAARCAAVPGATAGRQRSCRRGSGAALDFQHLAGGYGDAPDIDAQLEHPVAQGGLADADGVGGGREALLVDQLGEQPLQRAVEFLFYTEHQVGLACHNAPPLCTALAYTRRAALACTSFPLHCRLTGRYTSEISKCLGRCQEQA